MRVGIQCYTSFAHVTNECTCHVHNKQNEYGLTTCIRRTCSTCYSDSTCNTCVNYCSSRYMVLCVTVYYYMHVTPKVTLEGVTVPHVLTWQTTAPLITIMQVSLNRVITQMHTPTHQNKTQAMVLLVLANTSIIAEAIHFQLVKFCKQTHIKNVIMSM